MIKTFESFINEGPSVILNLKQDGEGNILNFHPVYAVTTTDYEPGHPPLIQSINRIDRTDVQKNYLKLSAYLDDQIRNLFNPKTIKFANMELDPYGEDDWGEQHVQGREITGVVEFLENKGYEFKKKKWHTGIIEITIAFSDKNEIETFLNDLREYIKIK